MDYWPKSGEQTAFFCRKVLIGEQHCFHPVEVELKFDAKRKLVERNITGGEFVNLQALNG
jgi:hypothetical protein